MTEPEISITIKMHGAQQATEFLQRLSAALKAGEITPAAVVEQAERITVATTSTGSEITATITTPRRKYRKRSEKPDPFELIKKGYVVRGPYKSGKYQEIWLANPGNMEHDHFRYLYGSQIDHHNFLKLKAMAEDNEKKSKKNQPSKHRKKEEKRPPAQEQSNRCSVCYGKEVPLGTCKSMKKDPHCAKCCTDLKHRVE